MQKSADHGTDKVRYPARFVVAAQVPVWTGLVCPFF